MFFFLLISIFSPCKSLVILRPFCSGLFLFYFILLKPRLLMFNFSWSPSCSCLFYLFGSIVALVYFEPFLLSSVFILIGALVTSLYCELEPLLLCFHFIWALVAPVYLN